MKTKVQIFLVALMAVNAVHHTAAQGTVFTYQGQLIQGTNPATGGYDMTFSLYPASVGGNSLAGPVTNLAVVVVNGLFTVPVDFGSEVFNGGSYWLGIAVRTNGGGAFTTLAPRTPVTPTPYAIYSQMGGSATNFTGSVSGDISGTQDALVVTTVGGQTAASIAQGVVAANHATPSSVPNSIVERDTNGNFSANALTLSGALNLPYPAILSSGGSNFLMEEGSLYMGLESAPFAPQGDLNNTGYGDYALGTEATTRRVIGNQNTAVGEYALYANTNGSKNTAVGVDALGTNTSGSLNTAVGVDALSGNTFGSQNTAVGEGALQSNNGFENTAVGFAAMGSGNYPSSSGNTANGAEALLQNETGTNNTAIGLDALVNNWGGCNNTADGAQALGGNWNGSDSTAVGYNALANAGNDSRAVAVGESALMNDNSYGYYSTNSGISQNTAVGYQALEQNNSGTQNTAEGYQSLLSNTNGSQNTAVGVYALQNNTSGGGNTAVGVYALLNNTSGSGNTADGVQSLFNNASGSYNTADGEYSLYYDSSGSHNTAVGYGALSESGSGAYNIAIGFNAGSSLSTGNSNIYIGNLGVDGDNGAIRIGSDQTTTVIAGIYNGTLGSAGLPVEVDAAGHLGVRVSSAKFKHDIQPMGDVSDVLLKLKPVTFKYNADRDPSGTPEFGLVAEQVNEVDPDLVVRDGHHQIYSVRYEAVNAMLLNEFLKQHQTVEAQNTEIVDLKARLEKVEQIISNLKAN